MSRNKIIKQKEYDEYPEYEKINLFIGTNISDLGIEDPKEFYKDFIHLLMDIGLPFDNDNFIKYLEIYKKSKKNKNRADKEFKKYIYNGY